MIEKIKDILAYTIVGMFILTFLMCIMPYYQIYIIFTITCGIIISIIWALDRIFNN